MHPGDGCADSKWHPANFHLAYLSGFGFFRCALKVQGEEPLQNLFIAQIIGPAVCGGDGGVEFLVREVQPGGLPIAAVSPEI